MNKCIFNNICSWQGTKLSVQSTNMDELVVFVWDREIRLGLVVNEALMEGNDVDGHPTLISQAFSNS